MHSIQNKDRYRLKNLIKFLVLCSLIGSFAESKAEKNHDDSTFYSIDARYHYGVVVPHHPNMAYLIREYTQGFEINLIRRRFSQGLWESRMGYPETGIGFWYSSLGEPDIYGDGFAIFPFINFNLFHFNNLRARYRVALGLGYADNPYEKENNIYNNIFGSHLNAYVGFGILLSYPITNRWSISSSLSLNHMSNGSSRKPNNGLNTASLSLGAVYNFSDNPTPIVEAVPAVRSSAREIVATLSAGRNQAAPYPPDLHWSGSFTITHLWYQNQSKAYGLGVDFIRYGGAPLAFVRLEEMDANAKYNFSDYFYTGITGTMESHLGSTALYLTAGVYTHYKTKPKQPVYARLGVKQSIYNNISGHFGIKANFFTAEFIELGIGYRLRYKQ